MQFVRGNSPLGEETAPPPLSLQEWIKDPRDRSTDKMWLEDRIPQQDFAYGPNAKSRRYRLYNKGIVPAFSLSPLLYFTPAAQLGQQVARGLYPPVPGVNMERQASMENSIRFAEVVMRDNEEKRRSQMREFEDRQRNTQGP